MGDQAVNIAHNTERYLAEEELKALVDLPDMAERVKSMVRNAIDSFVRRDLELARKVLKQDDVVDNLKDKIFIDVLHVLKTEIGKLPQGLSLILIARNLERIGDHATNIAEDVIYALTGEDVRHTHRNQESHKS
jgi:phosphate transport system protein